MPLKKPRKSDRYANQENDELEPRMTDGQDGQETTKHTKYTKMDEGGIQVRRLSLVQNGAAATATPARRRAQTRCP